jgi:hypothetical protein
MKIWSCNLIIKYYRFYPQIFPYLSKYLDRYNIKQYEDLDPVNIFYVEFDV